MNITMILAKHHHHIPSPPPLITVGGVAIPWQLAAVAGGLLVVSFFALMFRITRIAHHSSRALAARPPVTREIAVREPAAPPARRKGSAKKNALVIAGLAVGGFWFYTAQIAPAIAAKASPVAKPAPKVTVTHIPAPVHHPAPAGHGGVHAATVTHPLIPMSGTQMLVLAIVVSLVFGAIAINAIRRH
jgi:hypothetical protein